MTVCLKTLFAGQNEAWNDELVLFEIKNRALFRGEFVIFLKHLSMDTGTVVIK